MTEVVGGVRYDIDVDYGDINQAPKVVSAAEKSMVKSFKNVDSAVNHTERQFTQMNKTSAAVNDAIGNFGRTAGMAGVQISQFAGQVQGGGNVMLAVSQQAADLGYILGVPLLGAVVSIAAAIGISLAPSLLNAEDSSKKLEASMKSLSGVTIQTENSVSVLTKEIAALYKVSKEAALAQIITGLVAAKNATKEAGQAIRDEFGNIDGSLGPFGTSIETAVNQFDDLNRRIKDFGTVSTREVEAQNEFYRDFGETLGATGAQAESLGFGIVSALSGLKQTGDVQAFEISFAKLVNQFGASNDKLATFGAKLTTFFSQARTAAEAIKFLETAQKDLNTVIVTGSENFATATKSLNEQLQVQKVALSDGALAANLLAAAFALNLTSAEQLPPQIRALINELNSLENNKAIEQLKMQDAQLRLTANEYELFAAKQSAALSGATPQQVADIEARIKALQDLRLGLEAVSDQEAEDNAKRTKTIELETSLKTGLGLTPLQVLENQQKTEIEALRLANQQKLIDKAEYETRLTELTRQQSEERTKLIKEEQTRQRTILGKGGQEVLGAIGEAFGAFAAIAQQGGEESFQTYKNLASAQAAIAASLAIIKAYAEGGPIAGPILAGAIAGVTGVQIAAIQKQQYSGSGRLYGGPVGGGKLYPFMEDGKPEALQMGGKTYLWTGGGNGNVVSNKDMASGGMSGGVNVSVVVENYGSEKVSVSRDQSKGVTGEEVIKIIVGNINERGQVHSAIMRSTTAGNRT